MFACPVPIDVYLTQLRAALGTLDVGAIMQMVVLLRRVRERGGTVFVAGNGGSAANAAHLAEDLQSTGVRAVALDSVPALTAAANDYGYVQAFSRPLDLLSRAGDALVVLSVSGRSPNIVDAIQTAVSMDVVGLFGAQAPADTRNLCDLWLAVPSEDYGVVEDCHAAIGHALVCALRMDDGEV